MSGRPNKSMAPDVKEEQRVIVEPSDWELVRKCQTGDVGAFQELAAKYYQKVFMVILGILNHREDALEIAQETFYRALERSGSFGAAQLSIPGFTESQSINASIFSGVRGARPRKLGKLSTSFYTSAASMGRIPTMPLREKRS